MPWVKVKHFTKSSFNLSCKREVSLTFIQVATSVLVILFCYISTQLMKIRERERERGGVNLDQSPAWQISVHKVRYFIVATTNTVQTSSFCCNSSSSTSSSSCSSSSSSSSVDYPRDLYNHVQGYTES